MANFICTVCGTQYENAEVPPVTCQICADSRQYENRRVPQWTTHDELAASHRNTIQQIGPGLTGIGIEPSFAIGQRAILLRHPEGNILWDCVSLADPGLVRLIEGIGGLSAIAISHPHYYSSMVEWSHSFNSIPIYLHEDDKEWVMRSAPQVRLWSGKTHQFYSDVTLIRCGGHFSGGTVLHDNRNGGTLLTGDVIQVVADTNFVSFMYSYPNFIPLSASAVNRIISAIAEYDYSRVYGAFWGRVIRDDGKRRVQISAERYNRAIE